MRLLRKKREPPEYIAPHEVYELPSAEYYPSYSSPYPTQSSFIPPEEPMTMEQAPSMYNPSIYDRSPAMSMEPLPMAAPIPAHMAQPVIPYPHALPNHTVYEPSVSVHDHRRRHLHKSPRPHFQEDEIERHRSRHKHRRSPSPDHVRMDRHREVEMRDLDPRLESTPYYSRCSGRRRAVCIGINYIGQGNELKGCINDANNVRKSLLKQFDYPEDSVMILWDESPHPSNMPTRANMLAAMRWLVEGAKADDSLFFHYSGHGSQIADKHRDELDGQDEVIFPVDFQRNGIITDDEMHEIMVKRLPKGCRLTALFDSCHSGTVLDLPYIYCDLRILKHLRMQRAVLKAKRTEADVISWCSSRSSQKSVDTFIGGEAVGAMSHAFLDCLRDNPTQSYRGLLKSIKKRLVKYDQTPQLGAAHRIDTDRQFIM